MYRENHVNEPTLASRADATRSQNVIARVRFGLFPTGPLQLALEALGNVIGTFSVESIGRSKAYSLSLE